MATVEFDRVIVEQGKMAEKPCIRGHRFTVAHVVDLVAAGWDSAEIQADFPFIEAEDVRQALLFAARSSEVSMLPLAESA